jgi:hypothetical protein
MRNVNEKMKNDEGDSHFFHFSLFTFHFIFVSLQPKAARTGYASAIQVNFFDLKVQSVALQ